MTRSRVLPELWVGKSTSCVRLRRKMRSQKATDDGDCSTRVDRLISGESKSPTMIQGDLEEIDSIKNEEYGGNSQN